MVIWWKFCFTENLPRLLPRAYSVASESHSQTLSFAFNVIELPKLGGIDNRKGLVTGLFDSILQDDIEEWKSPQVRWRPFTDVVSYQFLWPIQLVATTLVLALNNFMPCFRFCFQSLMQYQCRAFLSYPLHRRSAWSDNQNRYLLFLLVAQTMEFEGCNASMRDVSGSFNPQRVGELIAPLPLLPCTRPLEPSNYKQWEVWLLYARGYIFAQVKVNMYLRTQQHFRLPEDSSLPLILIGPGTGISPFIGFLRDRCVSFNLYRKLRSCLKYWLWLYYWLDCSLNWR